MAGKTDRCLSSRTLSALTATLLLVACGGPVPPLTSPSSKESANLRAQSTSTSGKTLFYVSSAHGNVYVYRYPGGRLLQTLTGLSYPQGECADSGGDVFVTSRLSSSSSASIIYRFAHGQSQPLEKLSDPVLATSCSIDPTTGNLAAVGPQGIAIFKNATGAPAIYYSSNYLFYNCSYDNLGNLYVLVPSSTSANRALLVRFNAGSDRFEQIQLKVTLQDSNDSSTVQWDGNHLAVSSQDGNSPITLYRLRIENNVGTVVSSSKLSSPSNSFGHQLWITKNAIFGTGHARRTKAQVFVWHYQNCGQAKAIVDRIGSKGYAEPWGIVVSIESTKRSF
jgi:hypothetical protein